MIITRKNTKKVMVGNIQIGHTNKVVIQSMTNTKTANVSETCRQINELVAQGCEMVRVAVLDAEDCVALKQIVNKLPCPIIADIHYNYRFAIDAIKSGVAKIRINPANIPNLKQLESIVDCAKINNVAIRLGFNKGSYRKINNNALMKQILYYIKTLESWNFQNIIVSVKSSCFEETINLNKILASKIKYPIHIGVSEAGVYSDAIIKSTLGLYPLLKMGIGDTIRISISGSPLYEPVIAKKILGCVGLYDKQVDIVSCPTCGRLQWNIQKFMESIEELTNKISKKKKIAVMGCAVNGIGECQNADLGVYGNKTHAFIYKDGVLLKQVSHAKLLAEFKKLLLR